MDLTAPVIYNSLTAQPVTSSPTGAPLDGIQFDAIDISSIAVDGYMDSSAGLDGMDTGDVFARARTITISGSVFGSTNARLWTNVQSVCHAFHPVVAYNATYAFRAGPYRSGQGFMPLQFQMPTTDTSTWTDGYVPMAVYARATSPVSYRVERISDSAARGASVRFTVHLVAADPRKYQYAIPSPLPLYPYSPDSIAHSPTTATTAITYKGGNYPSWPWVYIMSSAYSTVGTLTIVTDSNSVTVNCSSLTNGTGYYLDYESRRLYSQSGSVVTDVMSALSSSSVFSQVQTGSTYSFSSTAGLHVSTKYHVSPAWA